MPRDGVGVSLPRLDQECGKCGGVTELVTSVSRFGERPVYFIFECAACKALTWIAEAVTK